MLVTSIYDSEEADPIIGFYTARLLRADTESDAFNSAKSVVSEEWSKPPLRDIDIGGPPQLSADKIEKVSWLTYLASASGKGFTCYTSENATRH